MRAFHSRLIRIILPVYVTFLLVTAVYAIPSLDEQRRRDTFEIVWSRVNEFYYDPTFNGVDWNSVKTRYESKLESIEDDEQLHILLSRMLGELKRSHFAIIPPSAFIPESEGGTGDSEIGATIQIVEDQPTITYITPDSPAWTAGLRPGFIVTDVAGKRLADLRAIIVARKERPALTAFFFSAAVRALMNGPENSRVCVGYKDGEDKRHTAVVKRQKPTGEAVKLGEMPTVYTSMQKKRFDNGIGYIHFNVFMMPLLDGIKEAIASFNDAPGIIIDLRRNPGGVGAMALPIAAMFCKEQVLLGTMALKNGEVRFLVYPTSEPYSGPLVFIIDETSASTSEILTGGLQEAERAVIVGQPSVGAVMPSITEKLPTGARLQFAVADFKTPKGVMLEGRGVLPDVLSAPTREALLSGIDLLLEKAESLILERRASTENVSVGP